MYFVILLVALVRAAFANFRPITEETTSFLVDTCLIYESNQNHNDWIYKFCYMDSVVQFSETDDNTQQVINNLGSYSATESTISHHIYREERPTSCWSNTQKSFLSRYTLVSFECCVEKGSEHPEKLLATITNVHEHECSYVMFVCLYNCEIQNLEGGDTAESVLPESINDAAALRPTRQLQRESLENVKQMFYFAYDSYMSYAFPQGELRPVSCDGGPFDLIKIPMVTLIDTLDTLAIMGNFTEFRRAVNIIESYYRSFDIDVNVSVFETTIRILGGLIASHLLAVDPLLDVYPNRDYNNCLLRLAQDLGDRLLPSFRTQTGIPYGTVNLKYGVPQGETEIASTAGAGSLFVEFSALSDLTGDEKYREAAFRATYALHSRRSSTGLLGKHIHIGTGRWTETISGIGSNSDSFYEYLLKGYLITNNEDLLSMFSENFVAIKRYLQSGEWFGDVDMFSGQTRRNRVENLHAFWPGVESSLGYTESAGQMLNALMAIWRNLGFLPEEMDQTQWLGGKTLQQGFYPLRPELIESIVYQYRATRDRSWLIAGRLILDNIETKTRTQCGYASVANFESLDLMDMMPSFFLSETCKYLYILFDEDNFVHHRPYVFTTEAHPLDINQLQFYRHQSQNTTASATWKQESRPLKHQRDRVASTATSGSTMSGLPSSVESLLDIFMNSLTKNLMSKTANSVQFQLPEKCPKLHWWETPASFDYYYVDSLLTHTREDRTIESTPRVSSIERAVQDSTQIYQAHSPTLSFMGDVRAVMDKHFHYPQLFADEWTHKFLMTMTAEELNGSLPSYDAAFMELLEIAPQLCSVHTSVLDKKTQNSNDDQASKQSRKASVATSDQPVNQGAVNTVEVPLGILGNFIVNVFADGFQVYSKKFASWLEISNIGQAHVFVREFNDSFSEVAVGNLFGNVSRCSVSIVDEKDTVRWRRSCAGANFGPMYLDRDIDGELLAHFDDQNNPTSLLCGDDPLNSPSVDRNNEYAESPKSQSWWTWDRLLSGLRQKTDSKRSHGSLGSDTAELQKLDRVKPWLGKIVLVQRGKCLFEDKAINAENYGAGALLVGNTEETLFTMAGKRDKESVIGIVDAGVSRFNYETSKIPAMMLTKSDVDDLRSFLATHNEPLRVRVSLRSIPTQFDSSAVGSEEYPKVRVQKNAVYVLTRNGWGVALVANGKSEWQLFVMSNENLDSSAVYGWNVEDGRVEKAGSQMVSTTATLSLRGIKSYYSILNQQCPVKLRVSSNGPSIRMF